MAKKEKAVIPFKLNTNIPLDKLEGVPPETFGADLVYHWLVKAALAFANASRGFQIQKHRQLRRIREIGESLASATREVPLKATIDEIKEKNGLGAIPNNKVPALLELLSMATGDNFKWAKEASQKIKAINLNIEKASVLELEPEDFKFVKECWEGATLDGSANELVGMIDDLIRTAQANHDRELSMGPDLELSASEAPVSSQEVKK